MFLLVRCTHERPADTAAHMWADRSLIVVLMGGIPVSIVILYIEVTSGFSKATTAGSHSNFTLTATNRLCHSCFLMAENSNLKIHTVETTGCCMQHTHAHAHTYVIPPV